MDVSPWPQLTVADNQIGLPITIAFSCVNYGGPLIDQYLIGDGAASLAHAAPFASLLVNPQRQIERSAGALVLIDALIDGLVREARQMLDALIAGDLLRAPGLCQIFDGEVPCREGHATSVSGAMLAASRSQQTGHLRLIRPDDTIAVQLAANGGG